MTAWMIYGANGYTGELTARLAVERGLTPVLAGRRETPIKALAEELGLTYRVASLDDPGTVDELLKGMETVLHCAGPFSKTSRQMVESCLRMKTNYLDITGEMAVFRGVFKQDERAKEAGIILMPGVGFDVVPTDCMAAKLKEELPNGTHLELAFGGLGSISRGTLKTSIEGISMGGWVRRDGQLSPAPSGSISREIPFARKPRFGMAIPWGDVVTAFRTTGIPNITVYTMVPRKTVNWVRKMSRFQVLAGLKPIQWLLKKWVDTRPPGPDEQLRESGYSDIWGRIENEQGEWAEGNFTTPEGYKLTALAALQVFSELGEVSPGAWTPAAALGSGLASRIPGVTENVISRGNAEG